MSLNRDAPVAPRCGCCVVCPPSRCALTERRQHHHEHPTQQCSALRMDNSRNVIWGEEGTERAVTPPKPELSRLLASS